MPDGPGTQPYAQNFIPLDSINAVSNMRTHNTELCQPVTQCLATLEQLRDSVKRDARIPGSMKACILIQMAHNLRVSEMLELGGQRINSNGSFNIYSKKSKKVITLTVYSAENYAEHFKLMGAPLNTITDRFYLYKLYKRLGFYYKRPGGKNNSVTHAIRHMTAQEIRRNKQDEDFITDQLHHKSKKSRNSYGN